MKTVKIANMMTPQLSWSAWIEQETIKRYVLLSQILTFDIRADPKSLLSVLLILSNLLTITYGLPDLFPVVHDGDLGLPCKEQLWNAASEREWQKELDANHNPPRVMLLRNAVSTLVNHGLSIESKSQSQSWSPFATSVVMHTIALQIWHRNQGTILWNANPEARSLSEQKQSYDASQTIGALARCRAILGQKRSEQEVAWNESEGPFYFNCFAALRVSYCRSCTSLSSIDPTLLLQESESNILNTLRTYVSSPQQRDQATTMAVDRATDSFFVPLRNGAPHIRRTAALTWSIEHALASWDTCEYLNSISEDLFGPLTPCSPSSHEMDSCNGNNQACWRPVGTAGRSRHH